MMTRRKIRSLALFSLLPTATLVATSTKRVRDKKFEHHEEVDRSKNYSYYTFKLYKKLTQKDKKNMNINKFGPDKQPVDENNYLLKSNEIDQYKLPFSNEKKVTFKILKQLFIDTLNASNRDRIICKYRAKPDNLSDKIKNEIEKSQVSDRNLFFLLVGVNAKKRNSSNPYLSIEEDEVVPAGSEIHVLVRKSAILRVKNGLKGLEGLKKGWGTGTIVGAILGGAAVIGAAGGAIYYALQPKAPVKKEPKEEQNEEKLETAPKKKEVA